MRYMTVQFLKNNQKKLNSSKYNVVKKAIENKDTDFAQKIKILPSTFTKSPRYMNKAYKESMQIVKEYGKPDLFLTFTCNPKWKEIH